MTRFTRQKPRMERGSECLHCAQNIEEAQHGGAGLAFTAGLLALVYDL